MITVIAAASRASGGSASVPLIVAITGLISAAAGLIALFRKVQAVHVLVNSQLSEMLSRVDQLKGVLQGAGLDVPARLVNGTAVPPPDTPGEIQAGKA